MARKYRGDAVGLQGRTAFGERLIDEPQNRRTGLTPGEIRQLQYNDVRDLFELKLGLRPANVQIRR